MYTKGEWKVSRGANQYPYSIESETMTIAYVKQRITIDETDCNAQLISSAPDLYNFAKEFNAFACQGQFKLGESIDIQHIEILMRLQGIAKRASNKAEGK